jgi:hypothetical protein
VRLLEADRGRLSDMLRSAGYSVDGLTVQMPASDKAAPSVSAFTGSNADNAAHGGGGTQPGSAQSDAQRGQSQARPGDEGGSAANGEEGDNATPARTAGGDLYL